MAKKNILDFSVIDTKICKTLSIADLSTYAGTPEGAVLQILLPDRDTTIELTFTTGALNLLNSNSLKYTRVTDAEDLIDLPDGAYTIKLSICPYESNWLEKDIYRVCKLNCKYNKALLTLDLSACEECFDKKKLEKLNTAWVYMQGVVANAENDNINKASELYTVANKILDGLLAECDC